MNEKVNIIDVEDNPIIFVKMTFGKYVGLYTDQRVPKEYIPEGLYKYEVRGNPTTGSLLTIEEKVVVNFDGTVITNVPIKFSKGRDYYTLRNWSFETENCHIEDMTSWFNK